MKKRIKKQKKVKKFKLEGLSFALKKEKERERFFEEEVSKKPIPKPEKLIKGWRRT